MLQTDKGTELMLPTVIYHFSWRLTFSQDSSDSRYELCPMTVIDFLGVSHGDCSETVRDFALFDCDLISSRHDSLSVQFLDLTDCYLYFFWRLTFSHDTTFSR